MTILDDIAIKQTALNSIEADLDSGINYNDKINGTTLSRSML